MGLEYLQRRRLHDLPGQPVSVHRHPQREEVLPHVQTELPLLQFVPKIININPLLAVPLGSQRLLPTKPRVAHPTLSQGIPQAPGGRGANKRSPLGTFSPCAEVAPHLPRGWGKDLSPFPCSEDTALASQAALWKSIFGSKPVNAGCY